MNSQRTTLFKPIQWLAFSISVSVAVAAIIIALAHQTTIAVAIAAPSVETSINAPAHPLAPAGQDAWTSLGGPIATVGQVNDIAVKPGAPDTIIALVGMPGDGGNTQIFRSLNGAATWSASYTGDYKRLYGVAMTGATAYAVGEGSNNPYDAILKSSDNGATWSGAFTATQDNNQYNFMAVAVAPSSGNTVVAAGHTNANNVNRSLVVRSANGGTSWSEILSVPDGSGYGEFNAVAINPSTPAIMFTSGSYNNQGVIYRTTNAGQTWTQVFTATDIGGGRTPGKIGALLIHPLTPTIIYAGASNGPNVIYRSTDNGTSWQLVNANTNWAGYRLAYKAPDSIYALSEWGDVHMSASGGISGTWQQVGLLGDNQPAIAVGASTLYAGARSTGLSTSGNDGANWTAANNGITSFVRPWNIVVDPNNPAKLFAGALGGGGWMSTNGGQTWSHPAVSASWWSGQLLQVFAINPGNSNIVYAGRAGCPEGNVLRSSNGGLTFTTVYSPANQAICNGTNENILALAIAPSLTTTVYAAGQYQMQNDKWRSLIARSTNDGVTWSIVYSTPNNSRVNALAISPQNANIVVAALQDCSSGPCVAAIARTTDGGATWSNRLTIPDVQQMTSIAISEQDPSVMVAASERYQVFKSTDSGATWTIVRCTPWTNGCSLPNNQKGVSGGLVAFDPHSSSHIFLAGFGYIGESFDGGINFTEGNGRLGAGVPQADPGALTVGYTGNTLTLYAGFASVWKYQATTVLQPWTAWGGPISAGGQVNDIAVISGTPDTTYALVGTPGGGGNTKVYRSTDNAAHWTTVYTASANRLSALSAVGQIVVAAGQGSGTPGDAIVKSTDGGAHWSTLFTSTLDNTRINFNDVVIDPSRNSTIIAAGRYNGNWNGGVVVSSTNGGATWTDVLELLDANGANGEFYTAAINPQNSAILFAAGTYNSNGVIYRSMNAGLSWTQVFTTSDVGAWMPPQQVNAVLIHPSTPNIIFAGTGPGPNVIYRSTDNGNTWQLVSDQSHWAGFRLGFRAPNTVYGIYDGGNVYVSASGGVSGTWTQQGSINDSWPAFAVGAATLYGGGQNKGVYTSTNNGVDWSVANTGIQSIMQPQSIAVDPRNPAKVFVGAGSGGAWLTTNNGQTWSNPNNTAGWWTGYQLNVFAINPGNSNIVYAGSGSCHQGSVLRSGDGGLNFTPVFTPANDVACNKNNENIAAIAIAPSLTTTVYAGGQYQLPGDQWRGMIGRSTNDGATWTVVYSISNNSRINMLAINPADASKVFAVGQDCSTGPCQGTILRSTDGGNTWTTSMTDTSTDDMRSIAIEPHNPTALYAANRNFRVYRSTDSGDTWTLVHCGAWDGGCALPDSQKNSSGSLIVADPDENGHVYLAGWQYIAESRDSGITWSRIDQGIPSMEPRALVVTNVGFTQTVYAGMSGVWWYQRALILLDPPAPAITSDATSGTAPLTVHFTATNNGGGATAWLWRFGDGATSTDSATSHSYTLPGVYTVSLQADWSGGNPVIVTRTNYITVTAPAPATTLIVTPAITHAFVGTPFTVAVAISNVTNLGSFEFTLNFSPTLLQVQAVTLGEFLGSTGKSTTPTGPVINNTTGAATFGAFTLGSSAGPNGNGNLAYVRLKPLSAGASALTFADAQVTDVSAASISIGTQNGSVINGLGLMAVMPVTTTVYAGAPFTVAVTISNVNNLGAFEFTFNFSPTLLQAQAVTLGEFPGSTGRSVVPTGPVISNTKGTITFGAGTLGAAAGPNGAGNLAYIRLSPVKAGASPLQLSTAVVTDVAGNGLGIVAQDGGVWIKACLGDFNGDGKYDIVDVQRVAYRWGTKTGDALFDPVYDITPVVPDGKINIQDVQYVAYRWGTVCGALPSIVQQNRPASVLTAPTTEVISVQPARGPIFPGDQFTVGVRLSDSSNLGSFEFTLAYSSTLMEAQSVTLGSFPGSTGRSFTPLAINISPTLGTLAYGAFSMGADPGGANGNGEIAVITFKALITGTTTLSLIEGKTTDIAGTDQTANLQGAPWTIATRHTSYMPVVRKP